MAGKHALHTPWYFAVAGSSSTSSGGSKKKKGKGGGQWEVKPLPSFSWVEDFWAMTSRLVAPSAMPIGVTLYLFRAGLVPSWEAWPEGGAWSITIPREPSNARTLDAAWEALALAGVGESLAEDPREVCGCALALRPSEARLQVWTRHACGDQVQRAIAAQLRALLPMLPADAELTFVPHTSKRKELACRTAWAGAGDPHGGEKQPSSASPDTTTSSTPALGATMPPPPRGHEEPIGLDEDLVGIAGEQSTGSAWEYSRCHKCTLARTDSRARRGS